jgi:hypothetical protein
MFDGEVSGNKGHLGNGRKDGGTRPFFSCAAQRMKPLRHFERRVGNGEGNETGRSHTLLPSTLRSGEKIEAAAAWIRNCEGAN